MMLKRDESVLVFVDVQGRLADIMHDKAMLDANLERMLRCAQLLDLDLIGTEQIPEKLGATSEPFRTLLKGVRLIAKTAFSCYAEPKFVEAFGATGKKQAILVGIETHVCIYQTAVDLLDAGIEVFVIADAVSSRMPENKELALQAMRDAGAHVIPTESALFALLRDAADPRFREMLQLIK
jgi:nicotinamidase-related amidase